MARKPGSWQSERCLVCQHPRVGHVALQLAHALDGALWARDVLGIELDDWQADVVREPGDQLLCVTRQGGKSNTVAIKALHHLLHMPTAFVIAASPSEDQSKELFRKLLGFYDRCPGAPTAAVRNTTELELQNGPRCCAVPGSERTIRSKSAVTMVLLDEAARIEDSLIGAVCPMMATTSGTLIALSSPFGKRGWFFEQWKNGDGYRRTKKTAYDIPRISKEFLEKEKNRLGPLLFRQEYLLRVRRSRVVGIFQRADRCLSQPRFRALPMIDIFEIGTIKRLPLGTDYVNVVAVLHGLLRRCPPGTEVVIDATGVGRPIADMFKYRGIAPWCVTATAGIEQTIDRPKRNANVPKLMLISRIQALLFEGRLKVQADIPEAGAFLEELRDFRVEYSTSGHMTYNAKSGRHDDMVSAAAVAAWRLSDGAGGWGPPSPYMAAVVVGVRDMSRYPRPAPWVVGLDLGKVNDPSVVLVMRRTSITAREFDAIADEPAIEPLQFTPVTDDPGNKTEELLRREAIGRASTPDHPEAGKGGEIEAINGPNVKIEYARGSVEWHREQEDKR